MDYTVLPDGSILKVENEDLAEAYAIAKEEIGDIVEHTASLKGGESDE